MAEPRRVTCPTCRKIVPWSVESPWRPFCSERCRLVDLGAWASERYRVPVVEDPDHPAEGGTAGGPPGQD